MLRGLLEEKDLIMTIYPIRRCGARVKSYLCPVTKSPLTRGARPRPGPDGYPARQPFHRFRKPVT